MSMSPKRLLAGRVRGGLIGCQKNGCGEFRRRGDQPILAYTLSGIALPKSKSMQQGAENRVNHYTLDGTLGR
jgi:hypothetical protein